MQRALFILTIFLNSALLFLIQPLVARIILPVFGGSPAVWSASMVFFQAFLLLGYGYAHVTTKKLDTKKQAWLHVAILIAAFLTLPFALPAWSGAVGSANPTPQVLLTLAAMVGASFFAVSAGAPLIQRWFSTSEDKDAADPYFLYSASNIGSLLALLSYPLVLEPIFRLGDQAAIWRWGYLVLILLIAACALVARSKAPTIAEEAKVIEPLTWGDRLFWTALSAVPCSLLLGVTSFLTTNIAPIPLLWVVPLSLYLLTFILAFAKKPLLQAKVLGRVAPLIATPLLLIIMLESDRPILPIALIHLATFFVLAWMCHRRLVEYRPASSHLTEFYLWISVGGVVGGLFNGLLAPVIFNNLYEYPLAVVLALMLRPPIATTPARVWARALPLVMLAFSIGGIYMAQRLGIGAGMPRTLTTMGIPLIASILVMDWPLWSGLVASTVVIASGLMQLSSSQFDEAIGKTFNVVRSERSFFGVHKLMQSEDKRFLRLVHGNTVHGVQDREHPDTPLTYYHPTGPIGSIMQGLEGHENIALVGLGVGSLSAYGQPGQHMTYYEIDPIVRQIATDPSLFTFVQDSKAKIDFVMGDARLTLEKAPDASYDLIVLDAFSSDAIPVHLLTIEAFQMYLKKLKPHGLIAVHISNRYLELQPVLRAAAKELRLQSGLWEDATLVEEKAAGKTESVWVVLARNESDLAVAFQNSNWGELYTSPVRPWTDDYSNVLRVFQLEK